MGHADKEESTSSDCPNYGSQAYWDQRYNSHNNKDDEARKSSVDDPDPGHAWYFDYPDLRPILLPLILGSDVDIGGNGDDTDEEIEKEGDDMKASEILDSSDSRKRKRDRNDDSADDVVAEEVDETSDNEAEGSDKGSTPSNENDDDDDDDDDDEDDDDEIPARLPLWDKEQAVSVIELGCGDVPLGTELVVDLRKLQPEQHTSKIICTDYSSACIKALQSSQETKTSDDDVTSLEFVVADARKLPYPDQSFELVLEKGTLDAMISDKKHGRQNCLHTLAECARVLKAPGYMVVVSHLNAHASEGLEWLENIVFKGLGMGDRYARWLIEVHGNDGGAVNYDDDDDGEEEEDGSGHLGPAVYVIQKHPAASEPPETIPVKFYTY